MQHRSIKAGTRVDIARPQSFPADHLGKSEPVQFQAAITGAACRLPGANDLDALWDLVASGRDSLSNSPPNRFAELRLTPKYIDEIMTIGHNWGGFVEALDAFDPTVFGMNFRDACAADPQQRLLMEVVWQALEDACEAPDRLAGSRTGVFTGISCMDYALVQGAFDPYGATVNPYSAPGSAHSIAANRISYALDLHGPSFAVDTACSSSFYALHMALKSMQQGECDAAIVCGVNLIMVPHITKAFKAARMISPDGLCKTFDKDANGYVRAEGAVAIFLKSMKAATADGSRVMGVITGSAVNHDGKTSGIVAPNGNMQVEVIRAAQKAAGVAPEMISFVEAHGTGTQLGDSTELAALCKAFPGSREQPLYVGSIKSNIGHLEPVSGLAGLIKTLKCFEHESIPLQTHLKTPLKAANAEGARVVIPTESVPWKRGSSPRIAGVSSFGFGGANSHIIVAEPPLPLPDERGADRPRHILKLAAKQADRLPLAARNLKSAMEAHPGYALPDICHSSNIGRADFGERAVVTASNRSELIDALEALANGQPATNVTLGRARDGGRRAAFMFSGQGSQYAGMARGLMQSEPVFRDTVQDADAILRDTAGFSLIDLLYGDVLASPGSIDDTRFTQPALFAVELGLARLLQSWGIQPAFLIGHSIGEYVAAVLDGIMTDEEALRLVAVRGRLMGSIQEAGAMAFVAATPDTVAELLAALGAARIGIAAVNGPQAVVVSGTVEAVAAFEAAAKAKGLTTKRLEVSHAFHSRLMEPILAAFREQAAKISYKPATSRFISTSLGRPLDAAAGEAVDADYWTEQLRNPVRFWEGLQKVTDAGATMLIEVGPQPTLLPVIGSAFAGREIALASCLRRGKDDHAELLGNLGRMYTAGLDIDWKAFDAPFTRKRLSLPTYPFGRKKFWFNDDYQSLALGPNETGEGGKAGLSGDELNAVRPIQAADRLAALSRDHVIRGSALFPGTGYLALMLGSHTGALEGGIELTQIKFLSALTIEGTGLPVLTVSAAHEQEDQWLTMVRAAGASGQPPRILSRGHLKLLRGSIKPGSLVPKQDEPPFEMPPEDFYAQLAAAGLAYGPAFRRIRDLKVFANRARAEIECAPQGDALAWPGGIDAGALDSCLHPIATLIAQVDAEASGSAWIPVAVDRLRIFGPQPARMVSHVVQEEALQTSMMQSFAVTITDEAGVVWADFKGLWLQRLSGAQQARQVPMSALRWRPIEPAGQQPVVANAAADVAHWQLLTLGESGEQFARNVQDAAASAGASLAALGQPDLKSLPIDLAQMRGFLLVSGGADTERGEIGRIESLLQVTQTLHSRSDIGRVIVVTQGAFPVVAGETANPEETAVWGFCRTLQWECYNWNLTIADLPAVPTAADIAELVRIIGSPAGDPQVAIRGGVRHVPRLAVDLREAKAAPAGTLPAEFRLEAVEKTGPASVRPVPAAIPEPEAGQVRIRPVAMGLNFRDLMKSLGIYPGSVGAAFWLGDECAGVVDAVGPGVRHLSPGDEVVAVTPAAFGSRTVTDARLVVPKPRGLTFTDAATIPIVFTTAWHCLVGVARLRKDETVLIHAGAGGVGLAAIQIAQMLGARVIASSGTQSKRDYLRSLGVEHVIDASTPDFAPELAREIGEGGVDVVLNSLAGPFVAASLEVLKAGGRFVEIGKRDFLENTQVGLRPFHKGLSYTAVDMERFYVEDREAGRKLLQDVMAEFAAGTLRPIPSTVFPMSEAPRAFQKLLRREVIGKVVLTNPPALAANDDTSATGRETYLITGGLGALGLVAAQWLARRGAQRIVLAGRSGPSAEIAAQIDVLSAKGSAVETVRLDVSDAGQVRQWLSDLDRSGDRLKGIIHAAGVLDDATLMSLDAGRLEKVMRPKARSAWILHELTRDRNLDLFMCFSSMSSVLGSPGQANYSAANAYLDGLCAMRRAEGLAGLSINWGPWTLGMAGAVPTRSRFEQMGLRSINADAGLAALEQMAALDEANVFGADADWRRFRSALNQRIRLDILTEIVPSGDENAAPATGDVPVADRAAIFELLRRNISEVTSIPESEMQEATVFKAIGFDSIIGLELILRLEGILGVMPDTQMLSDEMTLGNMTDLLVDALVKAGKRKPAGSGATGKIAAPAMPEKAEAAAGETADVQPDTRAASSPAAALTSSRPSQAANDAGEASPARRTGPARSATMAATAPVPVPATVPVAFRGSNSLADGGLEEIKKALDVADYADVIRPDFGAALGEARLDVDYTWAAGDSLEGSRAGKTIQAIDMLGGFGSTLFGHNHPALVAVLVETLKQQRPQFVQMSNRTSAGTLARELDQRLGQLTGQTYKAVLGSTGAEMVDAALKHALFEWAERRDHYTRQRRDAGNPVAAPAPVLLAMEGAYHGKTLGAYALTFKAPGRDAIGLSGPFEVVWLPRDDEAKAAEVFARFTAVDDSGDSFSRIAGLFVEPILGEGGIYPLTAGYARALRQLADQAGCPIIVDEIQCGMGRCGAFTAASIVGVSGDYFLFGKSLGGGLTKTCALMIDSRRYRKGFGFAHTSTFGEDDHGAIVALRALKLLDEDDLPRHAAEKGRYFLAALDKLRSTFPQVIAGVRGCGLMIGLELADQSHNTSPLISGLYRQKLLALTMASHLLHRSGIRVGTALSQPSTIRFEPSAYVTTAQIDTTVAALAAVCRLIQDADAAEFLRHFASREPMRAQSVFSVSTDALPGHEKPEAAPRPAGYKRAVFLAHLLDSNDINVLDPSLSKLSASEREFLMERTSEPFSLKSMKLVSPSAGDLDFEIETLPVTASSIIRSLRAGETSRIVGIVNDAIKSYAAQGTTVVGLGGLLSVVTRNGTAVDKAEPGVIVTTGNTYTAALARAAILKAVETLGGAADEMRIGIIGAGGNIGAALTQLLADDFARFRLIGRKETLTRVEHAAELAYDAALATLRAGGSIPPRSLAAALAGTQAADAASGRDARAKLRAEFGEDPFLPVSSEIESLGDCLIIVSASNAITPILNSRNVGKGVRIICDVSVPSDVDPELIKARPDIEVIRGGIALAPQGNDFEVDFLKLSHNCLLACMAETAILGLAGRCDFTAIGNIDPESVRTCESLAEKLGFSLAYSVAEKAYSVELE